MSDVNLVYGLGIAGGVLALARNIFISMILKVNAQALMGQVTKLVQAGNLDRALKLCKAISRAYLASGLIPALEVFQKGDAKRADVVNAYEQGVATKKPLLTLGRIAGAVAGLFAAAGLVHGVMHAETVPSQTYAAPVIALVLAVGGEVMAKRLQEESNAAFGRLLELLKDSRS